MKRRQEDWFGPHELYLGVDVGKSSWRQTPWHTPGFPASHWKRLRTNNVQERTNGETKRRSRVVQVFPSVKSLERLLDAVMCEQDEIWADFRYFSEQKMAVSPAIPAHPRSRLPRRSRRKRHEMARKAIEACLGPADRMEAA